MKFIPPAGAMSRLVTATAIAALTLAFMLPGTAHAQAAGVDPDAATILRRMTDYVGKLQRFSVDTSNTLEIVLTSGQKIQLTSASRNTVQRPNRLRSERVGDVISQSFYFDGRTFTIFNPGDGYYATVPAPSTIDAMVDFARDSLDVIAPAGDLITMDAYDTSHRRRHGRLRGREVRHRRGSLRPSRLPQRRRRLADLDRGRRQAVAPQVRDHLARHAPGACSSNRC